MRFGDLFKVWLPHRNKSAQWGPQSDASECHRDAGKKEPRDPRAREQGNPSITTAGRGTHLAEAAGLALGLEERQDVALADGALRGRVARIR